MDKKVSLQKIKAWAVTLTKKEGEGTCAELERKTSKKKKYKLNFWSWLVSRKKKNKKQGRLGN